MGQTTLYRSWMFVPGHRQRMIEKALVLTNVDAIMLDMEDGVAPAEKDAARRQIALTLYRVWDESLASPPAGHTPARFVRINAVGHERMYSDLSAIVRPGLHGLVLPKIENREQILKVQDVLDTAETEMGLLTGDVRLLIAIESPRGLLNAYSIASCSPRIIGLIFGAEDFGRELGLPLKREGEARDLIYARSAVVTAAAAAHVQAVDGVWPDLQDMDGMRQFALQSRRLGFTGMSLIHPSQIDPINAIFTPTPEDVDYCRRVIQAFEEAQRRGEGSIAFGGQLIDLPIVERARRTLALAESLGTTIQ